MGCFWRVILPHRTPIGTAWAGSSRPNSFTLRARRTPPVGGGRRTSRRTPRDLGPRLMRCAPCEPHASCAQSAPGGVACAARVRARLGALEGKPSPTYPSSIAAPSVGRPRSSCRSALSRGAPRSLSPGRLVDRSSPGPSNQPSAASIPSPAAAPARVSRASRRSLDLPFWRSVALPRGDDCPRPGSDRRRDDAG